MSPGVATRPPVLKLGAAFAVIYLLWGSNYLAIRFAVEAMPPFLMMGLRSLLAGAILFGWGAATTAARPEPRHWGSAALAGGLLFLGCHGALAWAEQRTPSGIAAVVLATIPIWMTLLDWRVIGGPGPTRRTAAGMTLGLLGVVLLMGRTARATAEESSLLGTIVLLLGALSWAAGSIASRSLPLPASLTQSTGMQLLSGGGLLALAGLVAGETSRLDARALALRPLLAFCYMVVMASLVAFTAYAWLLRVSTPARVGSYAFVNPVVAVFLGWALGGERLGLRTLAACVVIVGGVALVVTRRPGHRVGAPAAEAAEALAGVSHGKARQA